MNLGNKIFHMFASFMIDKKTSYEKHKNKSNKLILNIRAIFIDT